jgi:hypothetical protein
MYKRFRAIALTMAIIILMNITNITAHAALLPAYNKINKINETKKTANEYIIAQDGTGDFTTISAGVEAAQSGDTLVVYPGIYNESISIIGKDINITGINKDLCIIMANTYLYSNATLFIGAGSVSNLTIYGTGNDNAQAPQSSDEIQLNENQIVDNIYDVPENEIWEAQKNYRGYAVHVEQNYLYGKSLTFRNCRIISENSHCVGIGTRGESTITFDNCELIAMGEGGCLYMHDSSDRELGGVANLKITNSSLTSYICPYILSFESIYPDVNTTYLTFQNNKLTAVVYDNNTSYVDNNVNTFFDVETLSLLQTAGLIDTQVYYLSREEIIAYMTVVNKELTEGDCAELMNIKLYEGINYITSLNSTASNNNYDVAIKHQVIRINNSTNLPGDGWIGLDSTYLTPESYGNTLIEMNATQ